jgi:hypothetical protein
MPNPNKDDDQPGADRYNGVPVNVLRAVQAPKRALSLVQPMEVPIEAVNFGNVVNQLRVVPPMPKKQK